MQSCDFAAKCPNEWQCHASQLLDLTFGTAPYAASHIDTSKSVSSGSFFQQSAILVSLLITSGFSFLISNFSCLFCDRLIEHALSTYDELLFNNRHKGSVCMHVHIGMTAAKHTSFSSFSQIRVLSISLRFCRSSNALSRSFWSFGSRMAAISPNPSRRSLSKAASAASSCRCFNSP